MVRLDAVDFDEVADKVPNWYEDVNTALGLDKVDEALRVSLASLKTVRAAKDSAGEIAALRASAKANLAKGDVWNAKRNVEESLKLARQAGDKKSEAAALHIMAKAHLAERKPEAAKRVGQEALDAFRNLGDAIGTAALLNTMAKVRLTQKEPAQAFDLVNECINGFKAMGDDAGAAGQAFAMQTLLQVRLGQEKYQDALVVAEDMAELYQDLESSNGQGLAFLAMAEVMLMMGDLQGSLDKATTASEHFQAGGNKKKKATALFVMANTFVATDQYQEASELAEAAYRVFHEAHDKRGKADVLSLLAKGMISAKKYSDASAVLTEQAFLYRQLKDRQMEATTLQTLSKTQMQMIDTPGLMPAEGWKQDDIEAPVRNAKRAVALYGEMNALQSTAHAEALLSLSSALSFTGLHSEALGRAIQAQKVYQAIGTGEADALIGIAKVHIKNGQKELADKYLRDAMDMASTSGTTDQLTEAQNLLESLGKKGSAVPSGAATGRTTFTVIFGDVRKGQFNSFESRQIRAGAAPASASKSALPEFKAPPRHQVVYEEKKVRVATDPQTGMPL